MFCFLTLHNIILVIFINVPSFKQVIKGRILDNVREQFLDWKIVYDNTYYLNHSKT